VASASQAGSVEPGQHNTPDINIGNLNAKARPPRQQHSAGTNYCGNGPQCRTQAFNGLREAGPHSEGSVFGGRTCSKHRRKPVGGTPPEGDCQRRCQTVVPQPSLTEDSTGLPGSAPVPLFSRSAYGGFILPFSGAREAGRLLGRPVWMGHRFLANPAVAQDQVSRDRRQLRTESHKVQRPGRDLNGQVMNDVNFSWRSATLQSRHTISRGWKEPGGGALRRFFARRAGISPAA